MKLIMTILIGLIIIVAIEQIQIYRLESILGGQKELNGLFMDCIVKLIKERGV